MDLKVVSLKKLKMEDKVIQDKDQEKTKDSGRYLKNDDYGNIQGGDC